jgi:hypothetical protein
MKETSNRYALAALKERRASIDGEIKALEVQLRNLNEALCDFNATLSMFGPDYDPKTVRARRRYERQKLFGKGKLSRMILDTPRRAERPLAYREIIEAIAGEMGYAKAVSVSASVMRNTVARLRLLAGRERRKCCDICGSR